MKIATLNIDWVRKVSKESFEKFLGKQDFDFLILTEAINLELAQFDYKYLSEQIPENIEYENLNYTSYLKGEKAYRTIIYSKYSKRNVNEFQLNDKKTSLAIEFDTEFGALVIYSTIIGTWFNKLPFAKKELENCIEDCERIYQLNSNIVIVGDLNTSFLESEKCYSINSATTEALKTLFENLNLVNVTKDIKQNIDHIVIPKRFESSFKESNEFVAKDYLRDHKGVFITLSHTS
jgi:exonuclease III